MRTAAFCVLLGSLAVAQSARQPGASGREASAARPDRRELAGKAIVEFPHFQFTRSFNEGEPIQIAFDPETDVRLAKRTVDVFVIEHEQLPLYLAGKKLASLTGRPLTVKLTKGGVEENTFLLNAGTLPGFAGFDAQGTGRLGHGYDIVVDVNVDAALDAGDVLDGGSVLDGGTDEAGFYVVEDYVTFKHDGTQETGPYRVHEVLFDGGANFTQEDIYYPENIAALGQLPMISVSHGNGHDYRWYDHIGYHMASWGYVVMSHANNTGPGIETASTNTLKNTDLFLRSLAIIGDAGHVGELAGHVDSHRIIWIGHSRGGEGVVRAYRRLSEGTPLATVYTLADIKLVSSIAPTDFLGRNVSDMGAAPYHLWTGGADADVNGCANCDICQTFHQLERADGPRFSTSLHGAGHGDFHDGGGSSVAAGPCRIHRGPTHEIMRAYLLPLVQFTLDGNRACLDYLTRQWEEFRALGAPDPALPENSCVNVDLMYMPGPSDTRLVIDDYQSQPALETSSSGGAVTHSDGLTLAEGRFDDNNGSFTDAANDTMNGMTFDGPGDTSAGAVLEWNGTDEWLMFEVPAGERDLGTLSTLSFRAAQTTRAAATVAELGDLDFTVELTDAALKSSSIRISAYGGGIEEPYQRTTCGLGAGWANEFETIRIPLQDFRRDGNPLDLGDIVAITLHFGPASGSPAGRIGFDELEFSAP